jgi:hypothetical protein
MRAIVYLLILAAAAPAVAQDDTAAASETVQVNVGAVALGAALVHEESCADTRGNDVSVMGTALSRASAALVEVSEAYTASGDPSLLFWRGLLALCIDREDVGTADLNRFLVSVQNDSAYAEQVRDAKRRLRRAEVTLDRSRPAGPNPGGMVTGAGLAAGAGAFAGLSSWQAIELRTATDNLELGRLRTSEIDYALVEGPLQADRDNAFLGLASGLAVGSLTSFIIAAATSTDAPTRAAWKAPAPVIAALPTETGVQITLGGVW